MPTVPYPDQPRLQSAGIPSQRLTGPPGLESFGGGAAMPANAGAPITELQKVVEQATDHANQVAFTGAAAALTDAKTALLYHPEHGLLNQRGERALSTPEQATAGWDAATAQIEGSLTTDVQRAAFRKYAQNDWSQVNLDVQRHVAQQRVVVDTEKTDGMNAALTQDAVAVAARDITHPNPTVRMQALAKATANAEQVAANTRAYAVRQGMPAESVTATVGKAVSGFHTQVLSAMATDPNANWVEFLDYFDRHKDQLVGAQREEMARLVANNAVIGSAQQASDAILAGQPIPDHAQHDIALNDAGTDVEVGRWSDVSRGTEQGTAQGTTQGTAQGVPQGKPPKEPTLTEARAQAAASGASPRQKKLMLQMIDQEFAKRDAAKRDQVEAIGTQMGNALLDGVSLTTLQKSAAYRSLPLGVQSAVDARAKTLAAGDPEGKSDLAAWTKLYTMPDEQFARELLPLYAGRLSATDYKAAVERQQSLRKGTSGAADEHRMKAEAIKLRADVLWPTTAERNSTAGAEGMEQFTRAVESELAYMKQSSGKPLTNDDITKAVDRVTADVKVVNPSAFRRDASGHLYTFPTMRQTATSDSVVADAPSAAQRRQAVDAIRVRRGAGAMPSEAEIRGEWQRIVSAQAKRTAGTAGTP